MQWFNRWFGRKVKRAVAAVDEEENSGFARGLNVIATGGITVKPTRKHETSEVSDYGGTQFTMYPAQNGGFVVKFSVYDRKFEQHQQRLYIIGADEDTGKAIMDIFVLEGLRA